MPFLEFVFVLPFCIPSEKLQVERAGQLTDLHKNLAQKEDTICLLTRQVTELKADLAVSKQQLNPCSCTQLKKENSDKSATHGDLSAIFDYSQQPQQNSQEQLHHRQPEFHAHPWVEETKSEEVCYNIPL